MISSVLESNQVSNNINSSNGAGPNSNTSAPPSSNRFQIIKKVTSNTNTKAQTNGQTSLESSQKLKKVEEIEKKNSSFNVAENNEIICSHLYDNAYLNGLYSDLVVRIAFQESKQTTGQIPKSNLDGVTFKLHRIMAIRSPLLARMMKEAESGDFQQSASLSLQLVTKDSYLTRGGLGVAFGHLYASYSSLLLANNGEGSSDSSNNTEERTLWLRSVLSAARLLEMPDLSQQCIEHMKQLITMESVAGMAKFFSNDAGNILSSALQDLKDAVFTYLCKEFLDDVLENRGVIWGGQQDAKGYLFAVETFASLPFEWIKGIVESKYFDAPSEMERFNFAKSVVDLRAYQNNKSGSSNTMLAGTENVLLSFGAKSSGTGVTLVRKAVTAASSSSSPAGERRVWKASLNH